LTRLAWKTFWRSCGNGMAGVGVSILLTQTPINWLENFNRMKYLPCAKGNSGKRHHLLDCLQLGVVTFPF
jgi:hypothetical protein